MADSDLVRPGALRPAALLDWANPDAVYLTYGKIWFPVILAATVCVVVVRRRRSPAGFEKWAWRVALTGYWWAVLAVFGDYWLQWGAHPSEPLLTIAFVAGLPGVLIACSARPCWGSLCCARAPDHARRPGC